MPCFASEMDTAKLSERSLSSFWAEILPQFTLKNERVAETAVRLSWLWPALARFPGKWGIFSGTGDSKVTPDCLGLHWNGHRKTFWTLLLRSFLGRNIAPLHFKTERVADTVLRASWFWPTSARFPETSGIYSSPEDSKLTPECVGLQWNGHSKFFWTLTFEILGRKIAPLHFMTERVPETALDASWFWPTSPWVART